MANKKLKVELDVETSGAKRKVKRDLESVGGGASPAAGPSSAEGASRSIRNLGEAAKETQVNLKSAGKAFTGMALGLAASYAANNVSNPTAKMGLEYAGSAVSGAAAGAMVGGPIGAAIGGLGGLLKTFLDREGERKQMSKDFELSEERYAATQRDISRFRDLTETRRGGGTADQIPQLREIMTNFRNSADQLAKAYREELQKAAPDKERLSALQTNIAYARQMGDKYESAIESIEDRRNNDRAGFSATDALQKIGGGSGEAGGVSRMIRLQEDGNRLLKDIANNTKTGGATWQ